MHPYTYKVSLRIFHPAMDPQGFSDTLGLQPRTVHKAGNRRVTPTVELLEGHPGKTSWSSPFTTPDGSDLSAFLTRTIQCLWQHRSFFRHIRDCGGRGEFFVGL